ncbi:unnamed protein product [Chrysoparadoxa australica]
MQEEGPGSGSVVVAFLSCGFFSSLSYWLRNAWAAFFGYISMLVSIALMNINGWPHTGQVVILPQTLWSLLILSANGAVSPQLKIYLSVATLISALVVSLQLHMVAQVAPTAMAGVAASILYTRGKAKGAEIGRQALQLVLGASLAFHIANELTLMWQEPSHSESAGYSILKAGFFAIIGYASAGSYDQMNDHLKVVSEGLAVSNTPIVVLDEGMQIIWANRAAGELLKPIKPSSEELKHRKLVDMLSFADSLSRHHLLAVLGVEAEDETEDEVKDKDENLWSADGKGVAQLVNRSGETLVMHVSSNTVSTGASQHSVVSFNDLTVMQRCQKALAQADYEAAQNKMKTDMMASLSHELRTPLQGVMGVTSMLLMDVMPESPEHNSFGEGLSTIMASSRLLLTLINNLLDDRKIKANMSEKMEMSPVDIVQCMSDAAGFVHPYALINEVKIDAMHFPSTCVSGNSLRLQQVLINLLSNAVKYTSKLVKLEVQVISYAKAIEVAKSAVASDIMHMDEEQCKVLERNVDARGADEFVVVTVRDCGKGIPDGEGHKLFGEFSQLSTTLKSSAKSNPGQPLGTGLGLSLCYEFITNMQGHIWASNVEGGGGCEFSFCLAKSGLGSVPLSRKGSKSLEGMKSLNQLPDELIANLNVLVVDDNRINIRVLTQMLKRVGVLNVQSAENGRKAWELLQSQPEMLHEAGHIIFTDLQMPEVDGYELTEMIRDAGSSVHIVALTADNSQTIVDRILKSGADDILTKPIVFNTLKEFLHCP